VNVLMAPHQFFPTSYAGTERFTLNLAKQLLRMGHEATVIVESPPDRWLGTYYFEGVRVISLPSPNPSFQNEWTVASSEVDIRAEVSEVFRRLNVDLVHLTHPMRISDVPLHAFREGIPVVATLTDFWAACPRSTMMKRNMELCESTEGGYKCGPNCYSHRTVNDVVMRRSQALRFLESCHFVTAPSKFLAKRMEDEGVSHVSVVRHGIDYRNVDEVIRPSGSTSDGKISIGFTGTLMEHKGVLPLIEGMVLANPKRVQLKVYGESFHETEYYSRCVSAARNSPSVRFMGAYAQDDLSDIMADLDLVATPSLWWENSPLTILTAFAYKKPVLATDLGGMAEFVKHEVNGLTFKLGDATDIAKIIRHLDRQPEIVRIMAENVVRPRRIESEAAEYEDIYRLCLDTNHAL